MPKFLIDQINNQSSSRFRFTFPAVILKINIDPSTHPDRHPLYYDWDYVVDDLVLCGYALYNGVTYIKNATELIATINSFTDIWELKRKNEW